MGRPDLCCAIQRISELLACIIQVIFNTVEAIALGSNPDPELDFAYFRKGQFITDVNVLFDITLEVVECLCVFLRAIFPLNYIPGFAAAVDFEVCCIPQALLNTLIEIVRGILQVIISLATITIDDSAYCYWRLDKTDEHSCSGKVDEIGIIKQTDIIIDSFLPRHGEDGGACFRNCANDNGSTGIVPCICQIFNTLIPFRRFPDRKTNCDDDIENRNCPETDFCCPFSKLGFFIADSLKFINRGLVTLWQPWYNGLPEFFLSYVFCSEGQPPRCPPRSNATVYSYIEGSAYQNTRPTACERVANDQIPQCPGNHPVMDSSGMIHMRCGEFLCGRFHIIIKDLTDPYEGLLARCTCQFFGLLDRLIALLFQLVRIILPFAGWSCCFCGGLTPNGDCRVNGGYECQNNVTAGQNATCRWIPSGPCVPGFDNSSSGVLTSLSYVAQAAITALVNLLRQFPLACYWKPYDPITQVSETWIFSFLGPTANALCIGVGNLQCFAQSMFLLPQRCTQRGQRFLGSTLRWASEVVFRVIGFIEAFVRSFIEEENTCVGPNCDAAAGSKEQSFKGVDQSNLGKMMVILLSIPIDLLIGDSEVSCTTICPSFFAVPAPTACGCWNRSPNYGNNLYQAEGGVYEWSENTTECLKLDPTLNMIQHIGTNFGNTTGCCKLTAKAQQVSDAGGILVNYPLPGCQSPDDADLPADAFYNDTQRLQFPMPGSCALLGACRPDSLPSCANDPMTPIALSAGYTEAVDGIIMGLLRYMRCILSNIIGCDGEGKNCVPLGLIFYPAMLIFSLSWQILGGFIKFQVAMILFFFSIFQPPEGDGCSCWEHSETTYQTIVGGGNQEVKLTRYYQRVASLCYPCRSLGTQCGVNFPIPNGGSCGFEHKCEEYCPLMQRLREPTLTESEAMLRCLEDYDNPNTTKPMNTLTATEACTGHIIEKMYRTFEPDGNFTCYDGNITISGATSNGISAGVCSPGYNQGGTCRRFVSNLFGGCQRPLSHGLGLFSCDPLPPNNFPWEHPNMLLYDACPDPACQYNYTGRPACGLSNVRGLWDCPTIFGSSYPNFPLVTCGALQIVQNFLSVFDAFLAIFTTPLIVPPFNGGKRMENSFMGPAVREPRQAFNHRMRHGESSARFSGTIYGLNTGYPNAFETVTDALYNYDTSDCWADPVACSCRNLNMHDHCTWTAADGVIITGKRKRDGHTNMTSAELTQIIASEMFTGTTPCDHIIGHCAGMDWETSITDDEKSQWVNCLDKYIQGDRMKQLNDVFPRDFMYNSHSMMELAHNMYNGTKGYLARKVEESKERMMRRAYDDQGLESLRTKFPRFKRELIERRQLARTTLERQYNIRPHDLMYDAIVKADEIYYKYSRGYYGHMLRLASRNIMQGRYTFVTTADAVNELRSAAQDFGRLLRYQPLEHMANNLAETGKVVTRYVNDVMEEGIVNHFSNQFQRYTSWRRVRFDERDVKHTQSLVGKFQKGPLFQLYNNSWYTKERGVGDGRYFGAFRDHFSRVIDFQRVHWQNQSFSFFNADLKFWSASEILLSRWQRPLQWTPEQLDSWERVQRLYYQVYNRIWPGHLSREKQERFLFLSNCVILDRALDVTVKVIDYCANEAAPNLKRYDIPLLDYFNHTSPYRNDTYYGWQNRARFIEEPYVKGDDRSWIRPRLLIPERGDNPRYNVDYRTYRLATRSNDLTDPYAHGPARFNFFSWLLRIVEDFFMYNFGARADDWFSSIQAWLTNPNTDISQYDDVGLFYWLRFPFVCNFPENLNCSIGLGLETALLWTLVGFVGVAVVGAYVFPLITLPFQLIGYGFAFFFVFMALAFHTPPACMIMFPSFPLGVGVSLPQCAMDALVAFADKWITNCYSPLIIPPYMIAGDPCPSDPMQKIDFLNCRDVGVSDGIQNFLFIGFRLFGATFTDIVTHIAGSVIGAIVPGIHNYLQVTLDDFKQASQTQMERQFFCFWATLPTMVTPVLFLFLGGIAVAVITVPLVLLFNSLLEAFIASPAGGALPGVDDSAWIGEPVPSQNMAIPSAPPEQQISAVGSFFNLGSVFGTRNQRKEKKE